MSSLAMTLIDVGAGDSILLESVDHTGVTHYGLIDCNDSGSSYAAFTFISRMLQRRNTLWGPGIRVFSFVIMSHAHDDHFSGLKRIMQTFGTLHFWYPKSNPTFAPFAQLLNYVNTSTQLANGKVAHHQAVDNTIMPPSFGDATLEFVWPPPTNGPYDPVNENNNSIVISITLGGSRFILTGDCEANNWQQIVPMLPLNGIKVLKVPHHGARNGVFDAAGNTPWLDHLGVRTKLPISTDGLSYGHPHPDTLSEFQQRGFVHFRTDEHYHLTFETDGGRTVTAKWSRV